MPMGLQWLKLRMLRLRAWQEELRGEVERQVRVGVGVAGGAESRGGEAGEG